jgi:osmotically-inducible protein OsmY
MSTAQIEQHIQDMLNSEPALADTDLAVKADDQSVTITGIVDTEAQHDVALRIAQSYAGDRKIVDQIKVRGQA